MPRKYTNKKQNIYYYTTKYDLNAMNVVGLINRVPIYKPAGEVVFLTKKAATKHLVGCYPSFKKARVICSFPFNLDRNNVYESCGD